MCLFRCIWQMQLFPVFSPVLSVIFKVRPFKLAWVRPSRRGYWIDPARAYHQLLARLMLLNIELLTLFRQA